VSENPVPKAVAAPSAVDLEGLARDYEHRVLFFAHKVARSYMMGSRWIDDLVSAGYLGLAKALSNLRPGASEHELSAYVSQRIAGAVIDEARACITRNAAREVVTAPFVDADDDELGGGSWIADAPAEDSETPESAALLRSLRDRIERALAVLDADERRLLRAYMDGQSVKEIAEEEGVPLGTMRVRFRKLTRRVRAHAPDMRRMLLELGSA
jgi:RNA polymerase sigma factor (sigma-70 family)